jgi:hypothetical protein
LFLPIPAGSFDFALLSFQLPICALAAKQAVAAMKETATAPTAIRDLFMRRFRQKYALRSTRIRAQHQPDWRRQKND